MKSTGTFEGDFPGLYLLDQQEIRILNGKNQKAKDALFEKAANKRGKVVKAA